MGLSLGLLFCFLYYWPHLEQEQEQNRHHSDKNSTTTNGTTTIGSINTATTTNGTRWLLSSFNNNNNNQTIGSSSIVCGNGGGQPLQSQQQQQQQQRTATVLLLRHCEKIGPGVTDAHGNEHCSHLGHQRAQHLASLFGTRWPVPTRLYAKPVQRNKHDNYRQIETLQPLSDQSHVPILANHKREADLAKDVVLYLRQQQQQQQQQVAAATNPCNQQQQQQQAPENVIVISWKHSQLVDLAHALGWEDAPKRYPSTTFDQIWQLQYVFQDDNYQQQQQELQQHGGTVRGAPGSGKEAQEQGATTTKPNTTTTTASVGMDVQKKKHKFPSKWAVYGTVTQQHFDPLAFSYQQQSTTTTTNVANA